MNTATPIGEERTSPAGATQQVYRLSPSLDGHEYVKVSAVVALDTRQPETFIFPCTPEGKITDFGELPGSMRGTLNHQETLTNAGYAIGEPPK